MLVNWPAGGGNYQLPAQQQRRRLDDDQEHERDELRHYGLAGQPAPVPRSLRRRRVEVRGKLRGRAALPARRRQPVGQLESHVQLQLVRGATRLLQPGRGAGDTQLQWPRSRLDRHRRGRQRDARTSTSTATSSSRSTSTPRARAIDRSCSATRLPASAITRFGSMCSAPRQIGRRSTSTRYWWSRTNRLGCAGGLFHPVKVKAISQVRRPQFGRLLRLVKQTAKNRPVSSDSAWLLGRYLHAMKQRTGFSARFQQVEVTANRRLGAA